MLLNIGLLILLVGAEKKKISPYAAAVLFGIVKAVIYGVISKSVVGPLVLGVIYAGLAAACIYFMKRLDKREDAVQPQIPIYRALSSDTVTFRWEYIPLSILLLLIVGGEMLLL